MESNKDLLELEKSSSSNSTNNINSKFLINSPNNNNNNNNGIPKTKPNFQKFESSVLSRVKDFLPKLKEANMELQKKIENNEDVNIENVKEGDKYIQMNLALGILEHKEELSEDNIKINPNSNSNNKNKNKSIVELNNSDGDNNSSNNGTNKNININKDSSNCTNSNNNNILEILNQPTSVLDNFILNSDESDNDEEQEVLQPIELN